MSEAMRYLESETSLLVESGALLVCGVTVIIGGTSYKKYLRHRLHRTQRSDWGVSKRTSLLALINSNR